MRRDAAAAIFFSGLLKRRVRERIRELEPEEEQTTGEDHSENHAGQHEHAGKTKRAEQHVCQPFDIARSRKNLDRHAVWRRLLQQ